MPPAGPAEEPGHQAQGVQFEVAGTNPCPPGPGASEGGDARLPQPSPRKPSLKTSNAHGLETAPRLTCPQDHHLPTPPEAQPSSLPRVCPPVPASPNPGPVAARCLDFGHHLRTPHCGEGWCSELLSGQAPRGPAGALLIGPSRVPGFCHPPPHHVTTAISPARCPLGGQSHRVSVLPSTPPPHPATSECRYLPVTVMILTRSTFRFTS